MVSLYKDPKGENIFKKSSMSDHPSMLTNVNTNVKTSEVFTLKNKIKELEAEIEVSRKV